jgi:protein-S-isoprenylcysteine O-methyltransferase Ste14
MTVMTAVCLFAPAGTLRWWNAWVFLAIGVVLIATLTGVVFRNSPGLVEERMTAGEKAKGWDRVLVPILAALLPIASNLLAGFDKRFGWTSMPLWPCAIAFAGMLIGIGITYRAMRSNPFFSSHVRIQSDRGHQVVSSGPYGWIRHPGYTGTIIYNLCAPILLGSLAAFWVGVLMAALFVVRTALEDRTLQKELPGYSAYAGRVRYRLVPYVW